MIMLINYHCCYHRAVQWGQYCWLQVSLGYKHTASVEMFSGKHKMDNDTILNSLCALECSFLLVTLCSMTEVTFPGYHLL